LYQKEAKQSSSSGDVLPLWSKVVGSAARSKLDAEQAKPPADIDPAVAKHIGYLPDGAAFLHV
jgi:hypothetical protein